MPELTARPVEAPARPERVVSRPRPLARPALAVKIHCDRAVATAAVPLAPLLRWSIHMSPLA